MNHELTNLIIIMSNESKMLSIATPKILFEDLAKIDISLVNLCDYRMCMLSLLLLYIQS